MIKLPVPQQKKLYIKNNADFSLRET